MTVQLGKLSSGYPTDFYNHLIVTAINKKNDVALSFKKKFVDITPQPVLIKSFDDVNRWYDDNMLYYFQQYKFALYCATAMCGVSKDQLTQGLPLTMSLMNFHVLYQTKKILAQMSARNPGDQDFNPYNNPYDKNEYRKLLNEFGVTDKDIPEIDQPANGLGYCYRKVTGGKLEDSNLPDPAPTFKSTGAKNIYRNVKREGALEPNTGGSSYWGTSYDFGGDWINLTKVQQDSFNYNRVIPDHSKSFTSPGIVRLNDSVRAYVYCLLGAQVQARQAGSSLESQQEFLVLVNNLINERQTLKESIVNFQDALSKTSGKINYVIAKGLYMIPSDMNLNKLGQSIKGFNDQLKTAQAFDGIGIKPPKPPRIIPPKPKAPPRIIRNQVADWQRYRSSGNRLLHDSLNFYMKTHIKAYFDFCAFKSVMMRSRRLSSANSEGAEGFTNVLSITDRVSFGAS